MFKHILIPTDGSPLAQKAVKAGIRFASEIGARITVYHAFEDVLKRMDDGGYALGPEIRERLRRGSRQAARRHLDETGELAAAAGVKFASVAAPADAPHKGIIDTATSRRCDVIFMASHGRRGVSGLLMGSVTHKLLTHCKIPVLVYR